MVAIDRAIDVWSPQRVAETRQASLASRGIVSTARPWDRWLVDGEAAAGSTAPWLIVTPHDLTLEIVFSPDASLVAARRVLLRLLADRWNVTVLVEPGLVPMAMQVLGDLPIRVDRWDAV